MSASARKNSATCGDNTDFPNDDVLSTEGGSLRHAFAFEDSSSSDSDDTSTVIPITPYAKRKIDSSSDDDDDDDDDTQEEEQDPPGVLEVMIDDGYPNNASGNEETTLFDDSDDESADDVLSEFPILASEHLQNQYSLIEFGWTPTLKEILNATRSHQVGSSAFSLLRNHEDTLIRQIYEYLTFPKVAKHVKWTIPGDKITHGQVLYEELPAYLLHDTAPVVNGQTTTWDLENIRKRQSLLQDLPEVSNGYTDGYVAHVSLGHVTFPEPTGRNVNMMPFTLGDIDSLPDDLQCYYPSLIQQCPNVKRSGVAYLTVEEGFIKADKTQRRPGLHIEAPGIGVLGYDGGDHEAMCRPGRERFWGEGYYVSPDQYLGGIYIASNMASTCQVFDALVDKSVPGTADRHGGCEHLRSVIGDGKVLEANELVWMTDQTPHEALPQKESGYRQFFRLVMPGISHWYAKHSTPNPKVPIPDDIVIVEESKFVDNSS